MKKVIEISTSNGAELDDQLQCSNDGSSHDDNREATIPVNTVRIIQDWNDAIDEEQKQEQKQEQEDEEEEEQEEEPEPSTSPNNARGGSKSPLPDVGNSVIKSQPASDQYRVIL